MCCIWLAALVPADDIETLAAEGEGKTPAKSEQETAEFEVIVTKQCFKERN